MTLLSLKEIFPYIPGQSKDYASLKKALYGDEDWRNTKEILVWVVDTKKGALLLSSKRKEEPLSLLETPPPPHVAAWQ